MVIWVSLPVSVVGVSLKAEWGRSWTSSRVPYKLLAESILPCSLLLVLTLKPRVDTTTPIKVIS